MKPLVTIITINYNTQQLIEDCIKSVKKNLSGINYEYIVIDNNSNKFNESALKKIIPKIKIIKSTTNLGYSKANNLAAKEANGEYLWFLNSDSLISENNNLHKVVEFLDSNNNYAAASPLILKPNKKPQTAQFGKFPTVWRLVLSKIFKKNDVLVNTNTKKLNSQDVDWVSGASMFVKKSVFNEVGGFTPEYFLYYEDIDLCKKFNANRLKVRFVAGAKVIHLEGGSQNSSVKKRKIAHKSQDIYFKRWGSPVSRFFLRHMRSQYTK